MAEDIHKNIVNEDEIHVPKGFSEASPDTVPSKDSFGNLIWVSKNDIGGSQGIQGEKGDSIDIAQEVIVQKVPQAGQYSTITAALASITDASSSKRYRIIVGPGTYNEATINCKPYVDIIGSGYNNCVLQPNNPTVNFIVGAADCFITGFTITGCTGASALYIGITSSKTVVHHCTFNNNKKHVEIVATTGTRSRGDFWKCTFKGTSDYCVHVTSTPTVQAKAVITECITEAGIASGIGIFATGILSNIVLSGGEVDGEEIGDTGLVVQDGTLVECFAIEFEGWQGSAIKTLNVGSAPTVIMAGVLIEANTWDVDIAHPGTKGILQGVAHKDKVSIDLAADFTVSIASFDETTGESETVALGSLKVGTEIDNLLDLTFITDKSMPLGLYTSHDVLTDGGGTTVNIEAGRRGYMEVPGSPDKYYEVNINSTPIDVDPLNIGVDVYLIVNENGVVSTASSFSNSRYQIVLGRVVTDGTNIILIENMAIRGYHAANNNLEFIREAFQSLYVSGSQTIETPTVPHNLNVSQGVYWFSHNRLTPAGGNQITFSQHFRDGAGDWSRSLTQTVNNTHYDDNTGILHALTAGYFTKHHLFVSGDGTFEKYFLQLGQTEYVDLPTAQQAAAPIPPSYFKDGTVKIAEIIVQQGAANIIEVVDTRPTLSFTAAGGGGGANNHGDLFGLDDPSDHTWAVTLDGSRPFTGNQSLGGFALTNVGNINGVVPETHKSRHLPNGADPLTTGIASDINKTNAAGIANAFSRQDHTHRVLLDKLGSDEMTLQSMHNMFNSVGVISGFAITDNLNGTGNIAAGTLTIRPTNSDLDTIYYVTIPQALNVAFTTNDRTYIYVDYNAGSPQLIYSLIEYPYDHTKVYIGTVYNVNDTKLHIAQYDRSHVGDHALKLYQRLVSTQPYQREINGGADTTEVGTRNIAISAGKFWQGYLRFTTTAFDTSVSDTFDIEYRNGVGGWTSVAGQTQINNTQYDNGSGTLATLTDGYYGVHWVYMGTDSDLDVVIGQGNYPTPADARAAEAPTILPDHLANHSILLAKIIIQKNSATFEAILNAFTDDISSSSVTSHGSLSDLNDPNGHPWAMNIDGSKAMTGNLNMNSNDINNLRNFLTGFGVKLPGTDNILIDGQTNPRNITKGVMRFLHKPGIPSTRVLNAELDANGQNDSMFAVVNYKATSMGVGDVGMLIEGNINTNNSTGGTIGGLRMSKSGAGLVEVNAVETDPDVNPLAQTIGTFGNIDTAFIFDGVFTNVTSNFNSPVSNVGIFQNVNDYVYWGHATIFEAIAAIMTTVASEDITALWEFSNGAGGWITFGPNDNSNGFTINGLITWDAATLVGWAQDTVNGVSGRYWIRCQRTRTTITTPPIEQTLQVTALTKYGWNKNANLTVNQINGVVPQTHAARHGAGGADEIVHPKYANVTATQFQTTSATDVVITGFTLTPTVAGTYDVAACLQSSNSGNANTAQMSIYKNGVLVPFSKRTQGMEGNGTGRIFFLLAEVSMNGTTDTIDVRVNTSGGTLTVDDRRLRMIRTGV